MFMSMTYDAILLSTRRILSNRCTTQVQYTSIYSGSENVFDARYTTREGRGDSEH